MRACPTAPVPHNIRRDTWDGLAGPLCVTTGSDHPRRWVVRQEMAPLLMSELPI
jgi:hypothetical protein